VTREARRRGTKEVEVRRRARGLKPWEGAVEALGKASDLVVLQKYTLAERVVRRAVSSAPVPEERAMLCCWLGHLAEIQNQQEKARGFYVMAERHDPRNYLAALSLARHFVLHGRTAGRALLRAREAFRFADNVGERAAAAAVVALSLLRLGRRAPAVRALKAYGALWRRSRGQELDAEVLKGFVAARVATEYCGKLASLPVRNITGRNKRMAPRMR
jgi:hypothetical protein